MIRIPHSRLMSFLVVFGVLGVFVAGADAAGGNPVALQESPPCEDGPCSEVIAFVTGITSRMGCHPSSGPRST
jgi:hypothetical protein